MTEHQLRAKLEWSREYFKRGRDRRLIEDHPTDRFAIVECTFTGDNLRFATLLDVSMPKAKLPEGRVDGHLGWLARQALPKYLASRRINLFAAQEFHLPDYLGKRVPKMPDEYSYSKPIEVVFSDEQFEALQIEEYAAAREAFDAAVRKLKEFTGLWPEELRSRSYEVFDLLQFIDGCLAAGELRFMDCWYGEKQAMIRREFNHLMRLKNSYHPGYQQRRDNINGMLYSYSAPECWIKRPPELANRSLVEASW